MSTYKVYKGGLNKQDPYGCPPQDNPDCVQPEYPIGSIMGDGREQEQMRWGEALRRMKQFYGVTPDRLKVGDVIPMFLIPSYSDVRSVAYESQCNEDGFTFDVVMYDGAVCPPDDPCAAAMPPPPPVAGQSFESDLSQCCTVTAAGPADLAERGAETKPLAIVMRKITSAANGGDYIGSRAGWVGIVIKTLPASPALLMGSSKFRIRVNYENHLDCCHNCGQCC